jgi:hypothetical protein
MANMVVDSKPDAKGSPARGPAAKTAHRREPWWKQHSLGTVCFALFLGFWVAQSLTGWVDHNHDAQDHHEATISYARYLTTGDFYEATFENWESEFLQMAAYVMLTAFLVQRGSAESKDPDADSESDEDPDAHRGDPDAPWPVRRGGVWLRLYENSLFIAFAVLFIGSMIGHALGGTAAYNSEQAAHGGAAISVFEFVRTSAFWFQSFQNWQSEFLAVFCIVVLSIFLRHRGSPESKPVHAPHAKTGSD